MADESHDRITHIDLLNLWHDDTNLLQDEMREMRNEMRGLIGVGFALMLLFMAFVTSVR